MIRPRATFTPPQPEGKQTIPIVVPVHLPEPRHHRTRYRQDTAHRSDVPGVGYDVASGNWQAHRMRGGQFLIAAHFPTSFQAEQAAFSVDARFAALFAQSLDALVQAAEKGEVVAMPSHVVVWWPTDAP